MQIEMRRAINREKLIESLVQQFAEKIKHAPDNTLKDLESGKLTISLTPAVGKESGGAKPPSPGRY